MTATETGPMSDAKRRRLATIAEQIGRHQWALLPDKTRDRVVRTGRIPANVAWPTPAHREVIEAIGDPTMTDIDAVRLMHSHDVVTAMGEKW